MIYFYFLSNMIYFDKKIIYNLAQINMTFIQFYLDHKNSKHAARYILIYTL